MDAIFYPKDLGRADAEWLRQSKAMTPGQRLDWLAAAQEYVWQFQCKQEKKE